MEFGVPGGFCLGVFSCLLDLYLTLFSGYSALGFGDLVFEFVIFVFGVLV